MKDKCTCGHAREEHKDGFLQPCQEGECDCIDFEKDEEVTEL